VFSACVHRSPDDGSWWYHLIGLRGSGGSFATRDEAIADAREMVAEIVDDMATTGADYRIPE
jgi:hypothetical protein